ncbi:Sialic acid-binding Ig-like lectin 5 [Galemys pyrenaicus]|uniref:Sialic acid-binding Ig-like lectin 5 n=1 Tax=Galemys pyrenaicus TaxID=202257 RepID=A0A8J6DJ11_GALPY|nr:Sialic acid-binding Ig-like lectin 5 [Galemys pyrenaicus]
MCCQLTNDAKGLPQTLRLDSVSELQSLPVDPRYLPGRGLRPALGDHTDPPRGGGPGEVDMRLLSLVLLLLALWHLRAELPLPGQLPPRAPSGPALVSIGSRDTVTLGPELTAPQPDSPGSFSRKGLVLEGSPGGTCCRRSDMGLPPWALLLLPLLPAGSPQEWPRYQLDVQRSVRAQEGQCVYVPCSFSHPRSSWSPPTPLMYWFREGDREDSDAPVATSAAGRRVKDETRGRFLLPGDPRTNNCSLVVRPATRADSGVYFFRVERGDIRYSYRHTKLTLDVTELTQKPHVHIGEPLRAGHPAELACSLPGTCEEAGPLAFSWAGAAVTSLDPAGRGTSTLSLTPGPQHHDSNLTCRVTLTRTGASTERTVRLNVTCAWEPGRVCAGVGVTGTVTASIAHGNGSGRSGVLGRPPAEGCVCSWHGPGPAEPPGLCASPSCSPLPLPAALGTLRNASFFSVPECQALHLLCEAPSNPPASLSWFRGSPALNGTRISNSSTLELSPAGPSVEGELTCLAQHPLGSQHFSLNLLAQYPPRLLDLSCSPEDEDRGLLCSCSARAWPAPALRWRLGEQLLEGSRSNGSVGYWGLWVNSSLRLSGVLSSEVRLICEAQNLRGSMSAALLLQPGKPVVLAGLVQGALGGAGAMAVLSLCLCLLFLGIAKARKDRGSGRPAAREDEDPVMGSVAWVSGQWPGVLAGSPPAPAPPAARGLFTNTAQPQLLSAVGSGPGCPCGAQRMEAPFLDDI